LAAGFAAGLADGLVTDFASCARGVCTVAKSPGVAASTGGGIGRFSSISAASSSARASPIVTPPGPGSVSFWQLGRSSAAGSSSAPTVRPLLPARMLTAASCSGLRLRRPWRLQPRKQRCQPRSWRRLPRSVPPARHLPRVPVRALQLTVRLRVFHLPAFRQYRPSRSARRHQTCRKRLEQTR